MRHFLSPFDADSIVPFEPISVNGSGKDYVTESCIPHCFNHFCAVRRSWRALVAVAITAPAASDWPEWRGPSRDGRSAETNLPVALVAARRQPGLAHPDRQPIGAGRVRQSHLPQFAHARRPRHDAGTAGRDRCRDRQGRLGAPLQPLPERRAAASRGVGVAGGRSGDRQHLRLHGRRAAGLRVAGRQGAVGSLAARRVRRRHHARRPHHVADRRGRQGHPQHADPRVGRSQSPRQPLLRVRQEDRADDLDQLAAGAPLRHQLLDADRRHDRRHARADRRRHRRRVSRAEGQHRRADLVDGSQQARHSQQRAVPRQRRLHHARRREHRHHRDGHDRRGRRDQDRRARRPMRSSGGRAASCRRSPRR